jgi:nitroimidazol reductase NimA-like FMN-containing flavoprotein (pyridoxamine 5'-phosphate oxidase superfamily)
LLLERYCSRNTRFGAQPAITEERELRCRFGSRLRGESDITAVVRQLPDTRCGDFRGIKEATNLSDYPVTNRTRVKRLPQRAVYSRDTIYEILDEALVCHIGFVNDGQPLVLPMGYARSGDTLYVHGSASNYLLNSIRTGAAVCVTVTLVDGLVLARSAFHHSINYRSVVLFGTARIVTDPDEKMQSLRLISEHIIAGRWNDVRKPNVREMRLTMVVAVDFDEASAKVRSGPPIDDEDDYEIPVWAGVVPLRLAAGSPEADERVQPGVAPPAYVTDYRRPRAEVTSTRS